MTDSSEAESGWVRGIDAAAVGSLLLAIFVLLFGGFVIHLGSLSLRVHGPERLAFLALALIAIRHVAHPAAPLHRRIVRGGGSGAGTPAVSIARAALVSRVTVLLVGYLSVVTIGLATSSVGFEVSP